MRSAVRRTEGRGRRGETARAVGRRGLGSGGRVARLSSGVQERGHVARLDSGPKGHRGRVPGAEGDRPAQSGPARLPKWGRLVKQVRPRPSPSLPSRPRRGAGERAGGRSCGWPGLRLAGLDPAGWPVEPGSSSTRAQAAARSPPERAPARPASGSARRAALSLAGATETSRPGGDTATPPPRDPGPGPAREPLRWQRSAAPLAGRGKI